MSDPSVDLASLFQTVTGVLMDNQAALNEADSFNANHGDHMVEIFRIASLAALEKNDSELADAMDYAAVLLGQYEQNGSAQVYARGLSRLADQFRQRDIQMDDLLPYVRRSVIEQADGEAGVEGNRQLQIETGAESASKGGLQRSGEVLKALLSALAGWERDEAQVSAGSSLIGTAGQPESGRSQSDGLDMGTMFGMGMSYLQAKSKGGDRVEVLAETVVSVSPLAKVPHRARSGKLVFTSLLKALTGP